MRHLPVFLDIKDQPVLVVGGAEMAARKVEVILKAQARITIISEDLCPTLEDLAEQGTVDHKARAFDDDDLSDSD